MQRLTGAPHGELNHRFAEHGEWSAVLLVFGARGNGPSGWETV